MRGVRATACRREKVNLFIRENTMKVLGGTIRLDPGAKSWRQREDGTERKWGRSSDTKEN